MESSCGIDDEHVCLFLLCIIYCIEYDSGGVTSLALLYKVYLCSLTPHLKLIYRRRAEGICRRYDYLFAGQTEFAAVPVNSYGRSGKAISCKC